MMQSRSLFSLKTTLSSAKFPDRLHDTGFARVALACVQNEALQGFRAALYLTKMSSMPNYDNFYGFRSYCVVDAAEHGSSIDDNEVELSDVDEEEELCPVDCVREFNTDSEFLKILDKAKETKSLVVVDFYRTSCGSCKYIEQGFAKLCKKSGDQEDPVIFLKHNVIDEYDEQSEVAERLRIKTVPLFHFYKNGVLLEAFPTRDKERILSAILKYTGSTPLEACPS